MPYLCFSLLSKLDSRSCRVGGAANGNLENVIFTVVLYFYDYGFPPDTGEHCQLDSCNSSLAQLEIKLELFDKQGKDLKFVQLTTEHKVFKSSNRSNGIKQTLFNPSSSFQLWGNIFQTV